MKTNAARKAVPAADPLPEPMVPLPVRVPKSLLDRLEAVAKAELRNRSNMAVVALEEGLKIREAAAAA